MPESIRARNRLLNASVRHARTQDEIDTRDSRGSKEPSQMISQSESIQGGEHLEEDEAGVQEPRRRVCRGRGNLVPAMQPADLATGLLVLGRTVRRCDISTNLKAHPYIVLLARTLIWRSR